MTFEEFVEQRLQSLKSVSAQGVYGDTLASERAAIAAVEEKIVEALLREYRRLHG